MAARARRRPHRQGRGRGPASAEPAAGSDRHPDRTESLLFDSRTLGPYLERLYRTFDHARHRQRDPCRFLEPFRSADPRELEVAGLIASMLAFGQVAVILDHLGRIFDVMGKSPLAYVQRFDPSRHREHWTGFRHRWIDERDLAYLFLAIRHMLERHDSLGSVVSRHAGSAGDLAPGLGALVADLATLDPRRTHGGRTGALPRSLRFLLASPSTGASCKRLWMFARWMVRRPEALDGIDFGVWRTIAPARLVLPLDTHTSRLTRYLGLVGHRRTLDLVYAREATAALRELDPDDPVKYDFALAHIGISGACRHRRDPGICSGCALDPVCRL